MKSGIRLQAWLDPGVQSQNHHGTELILRQILSTGHVARLPTAQADPAAEADLDFLSGLSRRPRSEPALSQSLGQEGWVVRPGDVATHGAPRGRSHVGAVWGEHRVRIVRTLQRRESRWQQGWQHPHRAADAALSPATGQASGTVWPPCPVQTAPSGHFAHRDTGLGRRGASGRSTPKPRDRPSHPRTRISIWVLLAGVRGGGLHQGKNG